MTILKELEESKMSTKPMTSNQVLSDTLHPDVIDKINKFIDKLMARVEETGNNEQAYMMLSRWKMDMEYDMNGRRTHIWWLNEAVQVRAMIELWKRLPEKPVWLRAQELIQFKKEINLNEQQRMEV